MKKILTLLSLLLPITAAANVDDLVLPAISVIDGDTIETRLPLPSPLNIFSVRILGIDAPEKPAGSYLTTGKLGLAKCKKEADLALEAKKVVEAWIDHGNNIIIVRSYDHDKHGGRILGNTFVNIPSKGEIDIGNRLIDLGLAVPYFGGKKTKNWCAE